MYLLFETSYLHKTISSFIHNVVSIIKLHWQEINLWNYSYLIFFSVYLRNLYHTHPKISYTKGLKLFSTGQRSKNAKIINSFYLPRFNTLKLFFYLNTLIIYSIKNFVYNPLIFLYFTREWLHSACNKYYSNL